MILRCAGSTDIATQPKGKCNACKAVDRKRAQNKRKRKKQTSVKFARENEWCETIRRMFSPSAKLDYRFVVQVIPDFFLGLFMSFSYLYHAAPGTKQQPTKHQPTIHYIYSWHGYCFALFTRSTLTLWVCAFPVIFIYLYVFSPQSSWWSPRRGQRKPKQPKCRRENENKNNNLISFHGTFFSIVHLLWSAPRLSPVLRVFRYVSRILFFCNVFYCCSLRFCNSFFFALSQLDCIESLRLSGRSAVWNGDVRSQSIRSR